MPPISILDLDSSSAWAYENGYHWFSHPTRLNKLLAHYELYKSIVGLPGHVFELGVYKGNSLLRFATFRESLEATHSRMIVGFDAFGDFPTEKLALAGDLAFVQRFEEAGGRGLSVDELQTILDHKGFQNVSLVPGNVFETLPVYLEKRPETKIALLHLDMDVKEPTEFALEQLFERVVPGGLIIFDDYNAVVGATEAADRFVAAHGLRLEKLPFYSVPSFLRKP